mgnify:FL=1
MATTKRPESENNAPAVHKKTGASAARSGKQEHLDPEESIESAINKAEDVLYRNGKVLLSVLGVIVLVIGSYFSYKYL